MSGRDILPELESCLHQRSRRRAILFGLLVLFGYSLTWRGLETLGLRRPRNQALTHSPLLSRPSLGHLREYVTRSQSSYRHEDALLPMSAVLVLLNHQARMTENVDLIILFLVKYPFIKEIIIWNDNAIKGTANVNLSVEDFWSRLNLTKTSTDLLPILRLFNSPGGLNEMSGHMACSLAKFDTCYHIGENILNLNLDTLYTRYVEAEGRSIGSIVSHVLPTQYLAEVSYDVRQPEHHFESGLVSQLSRGTIAPKRFSVRYFQQLSTTLLPSPPADNCRTMPRSVSNDIQFSIWSNRRPIKLIESPKAQLALSLDPIQDIPLDAEFIQMAYQRLNETLQSSDPFLVPHPFPRPELRSDLFSDTEIGVASALDDRAMLITNLAFSPDWPLAVDSEISTCWKGSINVKEPGFVGLNFVKSVSLQAVSLFGNIDVENWVFETWHSEKNRWIQSESLPTVTSLGTSSTNKYFFTPFGSTIKVKKIRLKLRPEIVDQATKSHEIAICGWEMEKNWLI
ncbi:hypothetical protein O181_026491 [Austropuccinia psidii MF-1]|uniref:Uncharacterized protein n=1 Tax=Austropuccinia psidii MF-1 TaxID=1389203 RepID=A0A9Q3H0J8_9BASI|nr:hypothetical protein [Austropuccinia psidii MF-1]